MRLRLPPQFTIDLKTTHGHSIQQLEVAALDVEGNLARYETRGLRGWLFQPNIGQDILLVPSKTKVLHETFHDIAIAAPFPAGHYWTGNALPQAKGYS